MTRLTATSPLNMTTFMANADLARLFDAANVMIHTSTTFQIKDTVDTQEVLTLTGSFGGYNGGLYPTTGTITGGSYSPGNLTGFASLSFTGASMSVETFTGYVNTNNVQGFFQDLLHGADQVFGSASADALYGFAGNDLLDGRAGGDRLIGGLGNDTYVIDNSLDRAVELAGQGIDNVRSSVSFALTTTLERLTLTGTGNINGTGNATSNTLTGNAGANVLSGLGGSDIISGLAGNDTIRGGLGADRLTGGTGIDKFVFDTALGSGNVDRIADYSLTDDRIVLDDDIFAAAGPLGALAAGAFYAGTAAHDSSDRIIYDSATGKIYYDPDGTGSAAQVLFAQVATGLALNSGDFLIGP